MACILHLLKISLAWLSFFESNVHSNCELKEEEKSTTIDGTFSREKANQLLPMHAGLDIEKSTGNGMPFGEKLSEKLTPNIVFDGENWNTSF